ncbi:7853_t:CDS:1, partial [Funneliformis geosporum]
TAFNNTAFLNLTIHYVNDSWNLKTFLLDIIPMLVHHSEINIIEAIMKVLYEFDLAEKALTLIMDNIALIITCDTFIAEELEKEFNNLNFAHY